jgi:DNA polymerase/3'-5' exonuclease PolX
VNPDVHQQKLTLFEELSKGAAHDFFYSLGIEPLMPLFNISPEEFQTLWEYNTVQLRNLNEALRQLSSHRKAGLKGQQRDSESK